MFCTQCGNQMPDGAAFCTHCGKPLKGNGASAGASRMVGGGVSGGTSQMAGGGVSGGMSQMPGGGVSGGASQISGTVRLNTVFSGLVYEKTRGAYWEFGIWIAVCVLAVLSLLAAVLVDGDSLFDGEFRTLWLFLLIFTVGYGLLLTFRQRIVAIYYGAVVFFFGLLIPYFNCQKEIHSGFLDEVDRDTPASLWVLYVFAILVGIGLIACLSVHIFSRFHLHMPVMILGVGMMCLVLLLGICSYVVPKQTYVSEYRKTYLKDNDEEDRSRNIDDISSIIKRRYGSVSNGLGTTAYAATCLISSAYLLLFFRGVLDNRKQKIDLSRIFGQGQQYGGGQQLYGQGQQYGGGQQLYGQGQLYGGRQQPYGQGEAAYSGNAVAPGNAAGMMSGSGVEPQIQFLSGLYMGNSMGIQGEFIIGSAPGKAHVVIQDSTVSAQHCVIRFNRNTGNYEVRDLSKNGVYLQNGVRLQAGSYMACARGSILYLGSKNLQIRLV